MKIRSASVSSRSRSGRAAGARRATALRAAGSRMAPVPARASITARPGISATYYLQEKGLLQKFYREFVAHARRDPTGFATLRRVLGEDDLLAFQKKWERFVLDLRNP